MEVNLSSETYNVRGPDSSGLIPDGIVSVDVGYEAGRVVRVYFTPHTVLFEAPLEAIKKAEENINRVNAANREMNQERMEAVVGLLKKLASQ